MQFFLDTAQLAEIEQAAAWGILDGVTTNPSLMAKAGVRDFAAHYQAIARLTPGPVSAEVIGVSYADMVAEGRQLASLAPNIVVKIPFLPDGVRAIRTLSAEGIRTNCTLIFSPIQALIAAKAGATYLSPFVGRLDDIGHEGMALVRTIRQLLDTYKLPAKLLAASLRHPRHVLEAALAGADCATMPFAVMQQLFSHPLTEKGLAQFLADYAQLQSHA
ncbi:MAG: fructose-6-phosphate aldolase [Bacteroidia bacterium]|nr:fructose-6-phosphate aldolase [Bacteroidia bacterium]MDW8089775.1 fructose-6-phosphate aldolase [Bacteroidia bacterium]